MFIPPRLPWARQPQNPALLSPKYAQGLLSGFSGNDPFDFVQNAGLAVDGVGDPAIVRLPGVAGTAIDFPFIFCVYSPKPITVSGSMSVLMVAEAFPPDPGNGSQAVFGKRNTANPQQPALWFPDGLGNITYQDDIAHYAIADEVEFYKPFAFGVSVEGTGLTTAFEGQVRNYTINIAPSFTEHVNYGARAGAGNWPFIGRIYLGAVWDRAIGKEALVELTLNPWQLFATRRRSIIVPASTGIPVLSSATAIDITSSSARPRVTVTF